MPVDDLADMLREYGVARRVLNLLADNCDLDEDQAEEFCREFASTGKADRKVLDAVLSTHVSGDDC